MLNLKYQLIIQVKISQRQQICICVCVYVCVKLEEDLDIDFEVTSLHINLEGLTRVKVWSKWEERTLKSNEQESKNGHSFIQ